MTSKIRQLEDGRASAVTQSSPNACNFSEAACMHMHVCIELIHVAETET